MKCCIIYCDEDPVCKDMCFKHYEQMQRVGRIVSTEIEDWHLYPPEERWWENLPQLSKLACKLMGGE